MHAGHLHRQGRRSSDGSRRDGDQDDRRSRSPTRRATAPRRRGRRRPCSGTAPLEVQLSAAGRPTRTATRSRTSGTSTTARPRRPARDVSHTYTRAGTYNAKVTASDGHGGTTAEVHDRRRQPARQPGADGRRSTADPEDGHRAADGALQLAGDRSGRAATCSYVWDVRRRRQVGRRRTRPHLHRGRAPTRSR